MSSSAIPKATPFDSAVAEVQAKIEEMKTTLATLLRLQADYGGAPTAMARGGETEISHDSFFGMTIGDASKKYLSMVKVTKSTADIAEALERGGLKHSSKSFATTVRSILGAREDFTRVPNGDWGLSDWYPGQGRGKKTKPEKPAKAKAGVKAKKTSRPAGAMTRKEKILNVMQADRQKVWTAGDVANAIQDERRLIQATMSVMTKEGELTKNPSGGYLLPKPQAA